MPVSEKKLRSNPAWIKRHLTDPFVKKSVQEGYRARSVYKLMEIDDKDKIIKPGMSVVDLGAAPGSWTQIVKERLTDKDGKIDGKVIAMDILPMEPIEGVHFLQGRLPRAGSRRQANPISWKGRRSTSFSPIWPRTCPVLPRPTLPAACS